MTIEIHDRRFEKMREYVDGMACYRLVGSWRLSVGDRLWPPIRHINKMLAPKLDG